MSLGVPELIIIVLIVSLVFGTGWLQKSARNLGRAKVEIDKAQRQFNEAKAQVIETTGLEKADQALRKANRALNQSPQNLMKNATRSAMSSPTADQAETGPQTANEPAAEAGDVETINVDFS